MKRLPLLGLILALAACGSSLDNDGQGLACYDTGSGMKCVPLKDLPAGTEAMCVDTDGETTVSQSSASGPSLSDNDTSESSDAPMANVLPTGGGGDDSSSGEDLSGNSISSEEDCGGDPMTDGEDSNSGEDSNGDGFSDSSSDADGDGTDDSQDCDCLDPDGPPTGDPGGPIIN